MGPELFIIPSFISGCEERSLRSPSGNLLPTRRKVQPSQAVQEQAQLEPAPDGFQPTRVTIQAFEFWRKYRRRPLETTSEHHCRASPCLRRPGGAAPGPTREYQVHFASKPAGQALDIPCHCFRNHRDYARHPSWAPPTPAPSGPAPPPSGMSASDFKCITCGGPILENTTSTTSCVKCARLRTRRRNFAHPVFNWSGGSGNANSSSHQSGMSSVEDRPKGPHDSRDSGVSSGSSQDYGECTPPVEKSLGFPRFPTRVGSSDRPSLPFSQLVRKLSEVEGIVPSHNMFMRTSLDEDVDFADNCSESGYSETGSIAAGRHRLSQLASCDSASLGSCSSALASGYGGGMHKTSSPSGSFTSTGSYPYESFDDTDLTQSLPSCGGPADLPAMPSSSSSAMAPTTTSHTPMNYLQLPQPSAFGPSDRVNARSPIHFREGRRASDGFMTQNVVAFQQKLYDKAKAQGLFELHDVQEEHRALQSQFGGLGTPGVMNYRSPTPPESAVSASRTRKAPTNFYPRPSISKRISVPENFAYFPNALVVGGGGAGLLATSEAASQAAKQSLALQQHLRLLQKRPNKSTRLFQDGTAAPRPHRSGRLPPGKYSQPYLPLQEGSLQLQGGGGDFLFQPIAEDEPGLDELEAIMGAGQSQPGNSVSETQWQTLPAYMQESCCIDKRLDSPPPPAPSDPAPGPGPGPGPAVSLYRQPEEMDTLSPTL